MWRKRIDDLEKELETIRDDLKKGDSKSTIAKRMKRSLPWITTLSEYLEAVDTREIIRPLDRLIKLHYETHTKGYPQGEFFAIRKFIDLINLRYEKLDDSKVLVAEYGPGLQEEALTAVLGKPIEDATVDDLRGVHFSDFERALK